MQREKYTTNAQGNANGLAAASGTINASSEPATGPEWGRGWTEEQREQLRIALKEIPLGTTTSSVDAAFWERMERVARRVPGRSAPECARATRLLAVERAGFAEGYYATAFYSKAGGGSAPR